MYTESESPIETVVYITTDVEIILAYISAVTTVEHIAIGIVVAEHTVCILKKSIVIQIIKLIIRKRIIIAIVTYKCSITVLTYLEDSFLSLKIRQFALRSIVETASSRQYKVEILALMIVEAHIYNGVTTKPCGIHKTYLVEAHIGLIGITE